VEEELPSGLATVMAGPAMVYMAAITTLVAVACDYFDRMTMEACLTILEEKSL
jgi:hypothetical protein